MDPRARAGYSLSMACNPAVALVHADGADDALELWPACMHACNLVVGGGAEALCIRRHVLLMLRPAGPGYCHSWNGMPPRQPPLLRHSSFGLSCIITCEAEEAARKHCKGSANPAAACGGLLVAHAMERPLTTE